MKIVIIANSDIGLYKFRRELIEELLRKGNDIYIVSPEGEYYQELTALGCTFLVTPLERRGMNPFKDLKLFLSYLKILKDLKPDYALTYTIKPNIYGGAACRFSNVPYAINVTGLGTAFQNEGLMRKLVIELYKIAGKKAHTIFFENEGNCSVFVENGLVKKDQIFILNGAGVNLEYYKYLPYSENGIIHLLFVGRIMKEKGVEELFEAASRIKNTYGNKVIFDIVGFFEEAYKEIIEKLDQKGIIHFWGYQQDIRPFYKMASCLILPSYHEGMSNVLLEAAASGRALITSDIHGCKEAVADGKNGFLCEARSADSLFEAIKRYVDLPAEIRCKMGKKSRERMESMFDKKKVVNQTVERIMRK